MIKRDIPITTVTQKDVQYLSGSRKNKIIKVEDELGFSMTSVLNQRPTEILPVGISENSKMNVRYTKRSRAPAPPGINGHVSNGISNGDVTTEDDDDDDPDLSDLSKHKLNIRYFINRDAKAETRDLSQSKLNQRYNKKNKQIRNSAVGVSGQLNRRGHSREETHSDTTDWSHLVEDIFSSALNEHDEQDGKSLRNRIKGGGRGVPGLQTQVSLMSTHDPYVIFQR